MNGTHLAADASSFLEKRRRGLVRFCNALIQHPVLRQEQLVTMFLTVPSVCGLSLCPDCYGMDSDASILKLHYIADATG